MNHIIKILILFIIPSFCAAQNNDTYTENGVLIRFEELSLRIEGIKAWDEKNELSKIQNDSAFVSLDIGEILTSNQIIILESNYNVIKILERFENSLTIMNEGPHCDLINWKHYTSEWFELKSSNNKTFIALQMNPERTEKFVEINIDNLKKVIKDKCGDDWAELVKDVKTIREYPYGVSTSKIELKIILRNSILNKTIEKLIVFEVPMGC